MAGVGKGSSLSMRYHNIIIDYGWPVKMKSK